MGIEAYYFHGESTSSVCIGAWPRFAVKEGDAHADEASTTRTDDLIVVMNKPLPPHTSKTLRTAEGQEVKPFVVARADVLDESLQQVLATYPHAVNGENIRRAVIDPATQKPVMRDEPSFLVVIPRKAVINSRFAGGASNANTPADSNRPGLRGLESFTLPDTGDTALGNPNGGSTPSLPQRGLRSVGD